MNRRRQGGQGTVEYVLVLIGVIVVLLARPAVLDELLQAMKDVYQAFTYAISLSWFPVF